MATSAHDLAERPAYGEVHQDELAILRACDVVLGSTTVGLSTYASFAAATGRASVTTVLLMWSLPVFNVALSRLAAHVDVFVREIVRGAVMIPIVMLLYMTRGGDFERFWLPAEVMVVGQSVLFGCATGRSLPGQLITAIVGCALLVASWLAFDGISWITVRNVLGVVLTGSIVSLVAGQLGASLREARQRRDEAEGHKRRLEASVRDLASTRERLDAVLQCAPGFILAVDRDGQVEFANRTAATLNEASVIGTNVLEHVSPGAREPFALRMRAVLETGKQQTLEFCETLPGGGERWFATNFGARRSGEQVAGVVVISQDITELKRTQAEVVAAQRMAAVGTLAAGIAHELNTPIQFVNDSTTFLRDAARDLFQVMEAMHELERLVTAGAGAPELKAAAERAARAQEAADLPYLSENVPMAFESCVEGLERVTTIVRSMKEFAHPSQKEMCAVDLNRAIQNTLTIARNEYKYVADVQTSFSELPLVTCHANDLNQAVLNLIVNAAHAISDAVQGSERRGTISVRTRLDGGDVVISIGDTGTGIPEAVRSRIFEPFFTTKEVGKGTGQGLALVWNTIKERHGGDVSFETQLGAGTTFHLRLPVDGAPTAESAGLAHHVAAAPDAQSRQPRA